MKPGEGMHAYSQRVMLWDALVLGEIEYSDLVVFCVDMDGNSM